MTLTNKRKDLIKIAKLYYCGNMSQDEIATLMNISRPKVSRLLNSSRQLNIVQIKINSDISSCKEMEEKISNHFKLKKVIVVPSENTIESSKESVGKVAAKFLEESLSENIKIGIAWGTTLNYFVKHFSTQRTFSKSLVVQLVGGTYNKTMDMDGRELVKSMAKKLKGHFSILEAPLMVTNSLLKNLIMEEPEMINHFDLIRSIDIAFIGLGSSNYKETVLYKTNYIDEKTAKYLENLDANADICGHRLDKNGNHVNTFLSDLIIGVSLDEIKKIPLAIGIGAGNDKVCSIISAVKGGYLTGLIIDEIAAISIIESEKIL